MVTKNNILDIGKINFKCWIIFNGLIMNLTVGIIA